MKDVWPDYADSVGFYAVGIDPTEGISELEAYREGQGHPWPVAVPGAGMLADFRVTYQSTKVALDAAGVITYRDGFGRGGEEAWREVFEQLAAAE